MLILLLQRLYVCVDHGLQNETKLANTLQKNQVTYESLFVIVDLVIQNLVMCVHRNLAVNESIDCLLNLFKVLVIELVKLSLDTLRRWLARHASRHACHILWLLSILIRLGHGLRLLAGISHVLRSPWLWTTHASLSRGLHQDGRARICDGLQQSVVATPLLDRIGLELHGLLIEVRQTLELILLHLHVEVDARGRHRIVHRKDHFQWVTRRCDSFEDQVWICPFSWETYDKTIEQVFVS